MAEEIEFVEKYYEKLFTSPSECLHLYEGYSTMTAFNLPGLMCSVQTMRTYGEEEFLRELASSYPYYFVGVKSLDIAAQLSGNTNFHKKIKGSVVLITGFLVKEDGEETRFIQALFLAKRGKGYFILNEIFKFATEFDEAVVANEVTENNSATPLTEKEQEEIHPVALDFVNKYYGIPLSSPCKSYNFYQDSNTSILNPHEVMSTESAMQAIKTKFSSLASSFNDVKFLDIDSQPSRNKGIMILITGFLFEEGDKKIKFVQVFFLAKNAKGYFILNDISTKFDEAVVANEVTENKPATPST